MSEVVWQVGTKYGMGHGASSGNLWHAEIGQAGTDIRPRDLFRLNWFINEANGTEIKQERRTASNSMTI